MHIICRFSSDVRSTAFHLNLLCRPTCAVLCCQVRAASEDAARSIMGQLSASGVKLVLPALLKGLEDSAWRTKQGSIQLLGAMAHCAPKQLGSCLPTIVPRLGGVLGDPHPKVAAAAQLALQEVRRGTTRQGRRCTVRQQPEAACAMAC
jgi:hypothetical protein